MSRTKAYKKQKISSSKRRSSSSRNLSSSNLVSRPSIGTSGSDHLAGSILLLQTQVGNRTVQRLIAPRDRQPVVNKKTDSSDRLMREEEPPATLEDALGYRSKVVTASSLTGAMHPMTSSIVNRMKALLEASVLNKDKAATVSLSHSLRETTDNLREAIRRLGDSAPNRFLWSMEEAAWSHILTEVESGFFKARRGYWSEGMDKHWFRMLSAVDNKLIGAMSPMVGPALSVSPKGVVKRKFPLAVVPLPGAILNVYLNLELEKQAKKSGAGASAGPTLDVDEKGEMKPSVSAAIENAEGGKAAASMSADGPSVEAESAPLEADGGSLVSKAKLTSKGGEATMVAKDPSGWTAELKGTSGGAITYKISHPKAGGIEISGEMDKITLQALAPEIVIGDMKVSGSIEMELLPAPNYWPESLTQTAEVLKFWKTYSTVVVALAAITLAAPVVAAGGTAALEALPAVKITLMEASPALLAVGG